MARIGIGKVLAGAAGIAAAGAAAGAAWFYLKEKQIETPEHELLSGDGPFELRRYPALLVAETVQKGRRDRALGNGFGLLADYIFAETRGGEEIAMTKPVLAAPVPDKTTKIDMTAPVLAEREAEGGWRIRFVMPGQWTKDTLPEPGPGVTIAEIPARRVAAVKFSGRADDALLAQKEAELYRWIEEQGLKPVKGVEHAFYNSPFMPGPLRNNEVMFEVE